ncbi:MAG: LicD family protein [Clostridia bacterium]|nr:LicD family protein [Clostridia bacterium]
MKHELTLEEIHAELMEQLRDITAVCDRYGIEYNLMCGTLLGCIRHHGFIPWDDDVDLLMTRGEFTKFRKVYPEECDPRFELTYLDTWTPRVMNRDPDKAAAFTDFFILDPLPPEGIRRKMHLLHLHLLQGMMKKKVDYSRFGLKNRILLRVTHVMGMPFSYSWKAKRYEKVSTRYTKGNDLHMSNGAFELMTHVWHPEQFAEKIRGPFEDLQCLIPKKYDEVLTVLFGKDYMTPPPVEERVAKHLDL